ncbi:MAG: hypothetical protein IPP39_05290 [Chitinophagaceae bacterium]|nr:hypothetical protein [Chitinophagaceae bacterium]
MNNNTIANTVSNILVLTPMNISRVRWLLVYCLFNQQKIKKFFPSIKTVLVLAAEATSLIIPIAPLLADTKLCTSAAEFKNTGASMVPLIETPSQCFVTWSGSYEKLVAGSFSAGCIPVSSSQLSPYLHYSIGFITQGKYPEVRNKSVIAGTAFLFPITVKLLSCEKQDKLISNRKGRMIFFMVRILLMRLISGLYSGIIQSYSFMIAIHVFKVVYNRLFTANLV